MTNILWCYDGVTHGVFHLSFDLYQFRNNAVFLVVNLSFR